MTINIFEQRLANATNFLIEFTRQSCFNDFSSNVKYIITPNSRNSDSHLDSFEVSALSKLNRFQEKLLSITDVVKLLYYDGRVPLWINMTVYQTSHQLTIVELLISRRLRTDSNLNHFANQYPPFHPLVPMPPDDLRIEKNGKYDINYQKRFRKMLRQSRIFHKILSVLGIRYGG
jgi:hypothetical protein